LKTVADLAVLEAAAQVQHTPCGARVLVWHLWGSGSPVVLLHSGSGSWTHWVRNIEALVSSGLQVLVPDLPGFGASASPPEGHDADALPPWLEVGLDQLLRVQPIDLVGFSFGGLVAGLLAARQRQTVRRLVLVGAPALTNEPMAIPPHRPRNSNALERAGRQFVAAGVRRRAQLD
jgi:pimeloyl-ACP methyl ester carboxylesterase